MLITPDHPDLSVRRQCDLLGLAASTLYYRPQRDTALNEELMRLIDKLYMAAPCFGYRKMTSTLVEAGYAVNGKRVRRLMRQMGIEAVYPKPRTSLQNKAHRVYPYLLKGLEIDRCDQVWCADITYLPMRRGWVYLVAIMDWFSRYVIAWDISATMESSFCVDALAQALEARPGRQPDIFNTDQGSQFTSAAFTDVLKAAAIRISMDGRGRCFDNIFIERLWRSLKYEHVYLHDHQTVTELVSGVKDWITFYNDQRPHQALDYRTPALAYGVAEGPSKLVQALAR
jgi:putative transposase